MTRDHARPPTGKQGKWANWLEAIREDLATVEAARSIWREVRRAAADAAVPPTHFFLLYDHAYVVSQAVAVRRQAEVGSRVASLGALLNELVEFPEELSRDWFASRYEEPIIAALQWAEVAQAGSPHVDVARIQADLTHLKSAASTTKGYVDQRVAHVDRRPKALPPTHAELDAALDTLTDLFRKYNALITGADVHPVGPVFLYDVMAPFRKAWLPEL